MQDLSHGLIDYLKVLFRRKWFFVIPAFAGLVLGICTATILPKEYLSSMKVLVEEEKNDNPLLSNIAVSTSVAERMQTIKETMLGWDSLNELIKRLHLDKNVHSQIGLEKLVKQLQNEIDFRSDQNMLEISYVSTNPQQAQAVVKNVIDIFIGRNVLAQNSETANAIKFIQEQLHVYLGKIKSAEIADLKDKLNTLLIDSTELHPQVIELRRQIAKKMDELKAQGLEYTPDVRLSSETTPMVAQIQEALANIGQKALTTSAANEAGGAPNEKDLYKVMLMDKIDTVMARDVSVNESIYNNLLQRLETAKITQRLQASREGTRYEIIEDARVPTRPFKPNRFLVTLIGLFLGLAAGGSLVFMLEFLDKSFLDVNDASTYLNVPLLGGISKINTEESIKEQRDAQMNLLFWMVSGGVLMISFTIMLSSILNFQR